MFHGLQVVWKVGERGEGGGGAERSMVLARVHHSHYVVDHVKLWD